MIEDESEPKPGLASKKDLEVIDESRTIGNELVPHITNVETIECDDTPQPRISEIIELDSLQVVENNSKSEQPLEATQVLDITDKVDVSKNVDLFKAIFLSSSESENEEEEEESKKKDEKKEQMKTNVLSDLIPKIKPIKQGILSGVNFHKFSLNKPTDTVSTVTTPSVIENNKTDTNKPADVTNESKKQLEDLYGPKLPTHLPKTMITNSILPSTTEISDEWIEKEKINIKKSHKQKKDKKEKKHKKKHKKHDK